MLSKSRRPHRAGTFSSLLALGLLLAQPAQAKVNVIFDTDMDSDVDDVAALCQLHALVDKGEANLLGVAISGLNPWSGPCTDAINTFYGRPNLPIGVVESPTASNQSSLYAREVAESFPHDFGTGQKAEKATALYRRLLAGQPDGSVTLVSVGDTTNMAALLRSTPDQFSPLNGMELVKVKISHYVCMGSRYPTETDPGTKRWGNFRTDPESTKFVVENWPTLLTFTGGGDFANSMALGRQITRLDPQKWPVSLAYRSYLQKSGGGQTRHAADSIAVLVAVRGAEPYFKLVTKGHNQIDPIGRNAWKEEPDAPNQRYTSALNNPADAPKLAQIMEELAMAPPQTNPASAR